MNKKALPRDPETMLIHLDNKEITIVFVARRQTSRLVGVFGYL